ncbi:MAG: hypothetical protein KME45_20775 [Stenomitos rutilans HA7619-LM2]|jgi:hypothetical protein|nr:hypothetical protein [Stenomitos rutilans HA7619-LM2]
MTKHYILSLDPNAKYDWDRRTLRDPITADHPALADLIAQEVGGDPGSYLIAVSIEVKVLEKVAAEPMKQASAPAVSPRTQLPQRAELVA